MYIVHEDNVVGDKIGPPHQREIKHLSAKWTLGSQNLWLGSSNVDPGYTTNPHFHETQEEIFYCVSGKGRIRVDDEEHEFYPGMVCYVPAKCTHQLINDGDEVLKVVAAVSPAFEREQFIKDHDMDH